MRYLTIMSFARRNPDWKIKLYTPEFGSHVKPWPSHEHKYILNMRDYRDALIQSEIDLDIAHIHIDFTETIGISVYTPEVHKSDFLRWHILSSEGGLWSDMDILYIAPMPEDLTGFETGVCINPAYGHSIGFLLASPLNDYYKDVARIAKTSYKATNYQCLGTDLLNQHYRDLRGIQRKFRGVFNIPMDIVYPYDATRIQDIFSPGSLNEITERTIGVHWYAGHAYAGLFQSGKLPDSRMADVMKREGYNYADL